ncbi:hypothetical protein BV25DRAFT_1794476 [Artomyces pyxidatus]|uniref:Uncharacterized protein n=1 Tax=Artomyces pyxidatus TaxID=48021 RepID=A0ACB8THD6_9AGAM|nr:hypothetical protein BV25DRAFT_1794476 [Artomyces pyxidatus]
MHPPDPYPSNAFKASYDDLIDEYAAPFAPNTKHKSYTLDDASVSIHCFPAKPSFSTEGDSKVVIVDDDDFVPRPSAYPPPPQTPQPDARKWWQQVLPDSMACRLYVLTVLIETAIDLAIEGDLLLRFHEADKNTESNNDFESTSRKMPVYLTVFAFAHIFQFAMAIDAVYARNTLQFLALTVFNALFLFYAVIQSREIRNSLSTISEQSGFSHLPVNVLTTMLPIVIGITELAYIGLGWKIYTEFGWKVYKFLGADRRIKKMFAHYQIFQCLVKFDVFFWVGFCVQFIWLVLQSNDWEFYVTCAALPLSIVLLVEGHLAARYENKLMMGTFISGCVGAMVYFFYKLIKVLVQKDTPEFRPVWESLTTFSIISILLLLITFVYAFIVMRNFGRGLKEQITKKQASAGWGSSKHSAYPSLSVRPNRMSID